MVQVFDATCVVCHGALAVWECDDPSTGEHFGFTYHEDQPEQECSETSRARNDEYEPPF